MKRFAQFLNEEKNVHMTHLEDLVILGGVKGVRSAINYLRSLRDMLDGNTSSSVNVTVKWDGAPAIFAGIDPFDGKFFVAKKGIFNKNPKVYKTDSDIDADTSGDLNAKLKLALKYLPEIGIKGVIQGDFLYSKDDLKKEDINGESHITFHPNTIVYAVPEKSEIAQRILRSQLGVVWHTTYRGDSFEGMSASFGEKIAYNLKPSKNVWFVDATYKDVSGSAIFTKDESQKVTSVLSNALKIFNSLNRKVVEGIGSDNERSIRVSAFINSKVKQNERISNTKSFVKDMVRYISDYYQKEADKKKTEKGKQAQYEKRDQVLSYFNEVGESNVANLFDLYNLLIDAKLMILSKLDSAKSVGTFLKTKDGFEVTGQEGFVAIDRLGKNAVKLVDRLTFSKANFDPSYIKGWQR